MAVALLGTDAIRHHHRHQEDDGEEEQPEPPSSRAPQQPPLIQNVVLDDTMIHFRCGDVLGGVNRNDFGMIKFNAYKRVIPNTTKSIGIATQSFEEKFNRRKDTKKGPTVQSGHARSGTVLEGACRCRMLE